jgi:uncharacterized protein (TIGR00730 family)
MKKRVDEAENFRTRSLLVQREFDSCAQFFQDVGLRGVFLFFGSARARSAAQLDAARLDIAQKLAAVADAPEAAEKRAEFERSLAGLQRKQWMAPVWDTTALLGKLLSEWATSPEGIAVGNQVWSLLPGGHERQPLMVCTGGGPGFMEAANFGSSQVPGAKSIGVGVKLPFEDKMNDFVSDDCGIVVNSFYARKYWEVYAVKAMIVCPGGFGTLDEMFEVLTLVQCKHCPRIPVVLLQGKEGFFNKAVDWKFLADSEVVSPDDIERLCITDSAEVAFQYIVAALKEEAARMASMPPSPQPRRKRDELRASGDAGDEASNLSADAGPVASQGSAPAAASAASAGVYRSPVPPQAPFRRDRDGE